MSKQKRSSKPAGKAKKLALRRETIKDLDLPADRRAKVGGGAYSAAGRSSSDVSNASGTGG